ncbi:MAG TPA: Hsp20/alpha crystallin family protein [Nitrospirae bacterium]|nr:spore protein SP21 [bacterium BMS3Abin10]GBE39351.1 spore protein SP21 [bacterium BMS3Bbin08]HDK16592.1 Hsp20/alpha crystallin family protein [Nitrospirota bacterium]HDO26014.1 Hsp20/alpha crystallin family protein [Nitrospirota bacterium]
MAAERAKKTEKKELEPYRSKGRLLPFEQMEGMFEDFFRRPFGRPWWHAAPLPKWFEGIEPSPSVDIFEEKDMVVVKSELPGMTKDDIAVNLGDGTITLSGEKKKEEKVEKNNYYRHERSYGSFSRTFTLPAEVQTDKAKASFKNGVLEVKIPKTEEARKKTKKIEIE